MLYASQKSLPSECISPKHIRVFLATLLYSKYFKLRINICTGKKKLPWYTGGRSNEKEHVCSDYAASAFCRQFKNKK